MRSFESFWCVLSTQPSSGCEFQCWIPSLSNSYSIIFKIILLYSHSYNFLSGECLPGVYLVWPGVKNITILSYLWFLEDNLVSTGFFSTLTVSFFSSVFVVSCFSSIIKGSYDIIVSCLIAGFSALSVSCLSLIITGVSIIDSSAYIGFVFLLKTLLMNSLIFWKIFILVYLFLYLSKKTDEI
jgi:hypothetical protein